MNAAGSGPVAAFAGGHVLRGYKALPQPVQEALFEFGADVLSQTVLGGTPQGHSGTGLPNKYDTGSHRSPYHLERRR
jgi:hypothetical protein